MDPITSPCTSAKILLAWQTLVTLQWFLLLTSEICYAHSTGCRFPDYLQSSDQGMGNWTCKYGLETTHRIAVTGGNYKVYIIKNGTVSFEIKRRRCVRQVGPDTFVVEHVEQFRNYQCIQFIQRSPWVIQLNITQALRKWTNICKLDFSLEEYPWISLKGYQHSYAKCPFSGGFNFHHVEYKTTRHKSVVCRDDDPPIRIESDCVEQNDVHIHIPDRRCKPKNLSQRLICMASWSDGEGEGLALMRSANGDRQFHCLRVRYHNQEVIELFLYIDWVCYRGTDLVSSQLSVGLNTDYIRFHKAEKKIVSHFCSDEREGCSDVKDECRGRRCMESCEQCSNTTGSECEFSDDIIGEWAIGQPNTRATFKVDKDGISHPHLGRMKCVSFDNQREARRRAILWRNFENGCYPRFLCLHYNMPATSVMRYRLSEVLVWPLDLREESICDNTHFEVSPNIHIPTDTYHPKPWSMAVRSSSPAPTMPCVLPCHLSRYSSFVSHDNRTGCIALRPEFAPMTVSVAFLGQHSHLKFQVEKFHCIAALTYTSIVTLSDRNSSEVLCWVVIDKVIIVVIKTSACNEWTARAILKGRNNYSEHLKFWFRLNGGGKQLIKTCDSYYKEQSAWVTGFENLNIQRQKSGNKGERLTQPFLLCVVLMCILYTLVCEIGFPFVLYG